jgi:hypothetical protein
MVKQGGGSIINVTSLAEVAQPERAPPMSLRRAARAR